MKKARSLAGVHYCLNGLP